MNSSMACSQIPPYPCGMTGRCLSSQQMGAIKKHLRSLGYSFSPTVSTATILGPPSDLPVGHLQLQSKDTQTQTGAFKVIPQLVCLEVLVPSGFWRAGWLKKLSPGAHCEMTTGVRFCFAFQA